MYITNAEELVDALKPKLREYLTMMVGEHAQQNKFRCYVHDDSSPSMYYNPKNGYTTVHCFACGASHDIFSAAAHLEGLPVNGAEWMTVTLPHLAEKLGVEVQLGEASPADKARSKLYKFANDMATALASTTTHASYMQERGWSDANLTIGQISMEELKSSLLELGWTNTDIQTSMMLETARSQFFGEDKVTFCIRDYRGRPTGFVSRNLKSEPKYINTPETLIYEKRNSLLGIDVAVRSARKDGLYIVEGPGDLASLHRVGITNAVAICGTAFTADHLSLLKMLGIRQVFFALDWDEAGAKAIHRILKEELRFAPGVSCWVVQAPETGETDPSSFLESYEVPEPWHALTKTPAFDWVLARIGESAEPVEVCAQMVPIIASEESAVRRELFCSALAKETGISHQAIDQDVSNIRDGKAKLREERLLGAAESYMQNVRADPSNTTALMAEYESNLEHIEKEFGKDTIGVNHQISKYEALQEQRSRQSDTGVVGEFNMKYFTMFGEALSGGATWTDGILGYLGGRENSGKTATCIGIGIDIALHDPDAIVFFHFTDDSFPQVEPRFKTNISLMTKEPGDPFLTIGMANDPKNRCKTKEEYEMYRRADDKLRQLIAEERLVVIDMEDGSNLSTLEKHMRYIRRRHPEKKLMVICDNTHNYMDYLQLDQNTRMTRISNTQKMLTGKYHCAMLATVEYRKYDITNTQKMKLPTNDDIADARALKYRANLVIHVYNDLNDRRDDADIFWTSPRFKGERLPRLMLIFSKNKITSFKDKLMLDLDISTVGLRQYDTAKAREESMQKYQQDQQPPTTAVPAPLPPVASKATDGITIEADWDE